MSTRGRLPAVISGHTPSSAPTAAHWFARPLCQLEHDGEHGRWIRRASRGCLHHCLQCPIVPSMTDGVWCETAVLDDVRRLSMKARPYPFGDPDYERPGPREDRARDARISTADVRLTAKIEHSSKSGSVPD